jgi:hypothetical protein
MDVADSGHDPGQSALHRPAGVEPTTNRPRLYRQRQETGGPEVEPTPGLDDLQDTPARNPPQPSDPRRCTYARTASSPASPPTSGIQNSSSQPPSLRASAPKASRSCAMPARARSSTGVQQAPPTTTVDQLNDPARGDTRNFVGVNVSEIRTHVPGRSPYSEEIHHVDQRSSWLSSAVKFATLRRKAGRSVAHVGDAPADPVHGKGTSPRSGSQGAGSRWSAHQPCIASLRWRWMRQPRKSRPSSIWVIKVFSGDRRRPIVDRTSVICSRRASASAFVPATIRHQSSA